MHTQTHMLLGAAVFGRGCPAPAWAAVAGGLLPDMASFLLVLGAAASGMSAEAIFRTAYFSEPWQAVMAPFHAVPLWGLAVALALAFRARAATAFAASGLLHQAGDFPLHHDDPHRHFWPFSDWRFESPLSYWDPDHGGAWLQPLEIAAGLALTVLLWRRWPNRWTRAVLVLAALVYVAQGTAANVLLGFG
ncbi:MAG: cobalamin biosynthesis protein CobQ [Proteobacteria bacterium]|nr:cobalamin biosynthesis protein CobQ [Pseudomonadota bacterium]